MKTIKSIAIAFLFFTITTNAQITKGNWMVGGTTSFSYSKTENKNTSTSGTTITFNPVGVYSISLEPNVGYFVIDKLALGCKLDYINGFSEGEKINTESMNLSFAPFVRYYLLKEEKMYNIFLEPSYYRFLSDGLGNASGYGVKSGFVVFMNSSVGFETSVNYTYSSSVKYKSNAIFFGFGFQIHLEKEK